MTGSSPRETEELGPGGFQAWPAAARGTQMPRRRREPGRCGGQGCGGRGSGRRENPPAPGRDRRSAGARRERPPRVGPACPEPPATNSWPKAGCSCAQLGMQIYANPHCPRLVVRAAQRKRSSASQRSSDRVWGGGASSPPRSHLTTLTGACDEHGVPSPSPW